tara:strand:- start:8488 stop:9483 length:996 start_codon:yes stop_codon:yes gene_type:complete
MFKKLYDSLSMGVHLELLVNDDFVCLKVWSPIDEDEFNGAMPNRPFPEQSLHMPAAPALGEFPAAMSGVFHDKLPTGILHGTMVTGETFLPQIPANIRDTYTEKLKDTWFRNTGFSWVDPTDPSIASGEKSDVACWVIGIKPDFSASASYNSLTNTHYSKAHPLRSVRQQNAPAALFIYKSFNTDNFTDCSITMKYNRGCGFSTNIMNDWLIGTDEKALFKTSGDGYNYLGEMNEAFPTFTVTSGGTSIDADGTDTVAFKMVDKDGALIARTSEAYLESTAGYLPKTRVPITDGLGTFKVTALGLESGDTFKVKIGFRNLTGVQDVNYTVA